MKNIYYSMFNAPTIHQDSINTFSNNCLHPSFCLYPPIQIYVYIAVPVCTYTYLLNLPVSVHFYLYQPILNLIQLTLFTSFFLY